MAAKGVELASAYVSLSISTDGIPAQIKKALGSAGDEPRKQGRKAGQQYSSSFGSALSSGMASGGVTKWFSDFKNDARKSGNTAGYVAGRAMGTAMTAALAASTAGLGAIVGGIGYTLFKGFDRYRSLDATAKRLQGMGKTGEQVKSIISDINSVVDKTPIGLDAAAGAATQFLSGGVKEGKQLKRALGAIADAAGASGGDFEELAIIFGQVMNKGKLQAEEMMQFNERSINIQAALRDEFGLTGDELEKMSKDGSISFDMLIQAVDGKFGGMAKRMGDTVDGALSMMNSAVSRTGSNFIAAIFGDPLSTTEGPGGMAQSINNVTAKIEELNQWVVENKDGIKQFFTDAGEAVKGVANAVKDVGGFLREHKEILVAGAAIWAGWKAISATAAVVSSLTTISGLLKGIPGLAAAAGSAPGWSALGAAAAGVSVAATAPGVADHLSDGANFPRSRVPRLDRNGNLVTDGTPYGVPQPFAPDSLGGPGNAQRQRRGRDPVDPTGGLLSGPYSGSGAPAAGSGAEGWRPAVRSALNAYGPGLGITNFAAWEDALVRQIQSESGGNPRADNPNDSNGRGGQQHVSGLLQFLPSTFAAHNITGGAYLDPNAQIAAALDYVMSKYGVDKNGAPLQIGRGVGYATGGAARGAGSTTADSIPAWLSNGEHVLTASDVAALGGQGGVYAFRNALHRKDGGEIFKRGAAIWPPEPVGPKDKSRPGGIPDLGPGKNKNQIGLPDWSTPGQGWGEPPPGWWLKPINPDDYLFPEWWPPGMEGIWKHPYPKERINPWGFAEGGAVAIEDILMLAQQGVDPNTLTHGQAQGAQPGPTPEQLQGLESQNIPGRTEGYIPAGAGFSGKTGGGFAGSLINLGGEAAKGAIQFGADAAKMAVSAAITAGAGAGSFGAAAAAGPAAGAAAAIGIDIAAAAAKRGVDYGTELANIGVGAFTEIASPFGAPRWLSDVDPTSFMPQLGILSAATTSVEQMAQAQLQNQLTPEQVAAGAPPVPPGNQHMPPGAQPGAPVPPGPTQPQPQTPPPPLAQQQAPNPTDPLSWLKFGLFDSGGVLQPNTGAINLSNRPEYVFTQSQLKQMEAGASQNAGGSVTYNVQGVDLNEALRELKKVERRNSGPTMRGKAGR